MNMHQEPQAGVGIGWLGRRTIEKLGDTTLARLFEVYSDLRTTAFDSRFVFWCGRDGRVRGGACGGRVIGGHLFLWVEEVTEDGFKGSLLHFEVIHYDLKKFECHTPKAMRSDYIEWFDVFVTKLAANPEGFLERDDDRSEVAGGEVLHRADGRGGRQGGELRARTA